jgi:hypothetical protein
MRKLASNENSSTLDMPKYNAVRPVPKSVSLGGLSAPDRLSEQPSKDPAHLESYCRPVYRKVVLRISEHCQPLEYQLVECNGYCHSQSMIWKNQDEVQSTSCCTLASVNRKVAKIYCTRSLQPEEVQARFYSKSKDDDIYRLFQESFGSSTWTEQVIYKSKHVYSGYYSVILYFDASCECQFI